METLMRARGGWARATAQPPRFWPYSRRSIRALRREAAGLTQPGSVRELRPHGQGSATRFLLGRRTITGTRLLQLRSPDALSHLTSGDHHLGVASALSVADGSLNA